MSIEFGGSLYWILNTHSEPGDLLVFQATKEILLGDQKDHVPTVLHAVILMRTHDNLLVTALYNNKDDVTTNPHSTYWIGSPRIPVTTMGAGYEICHDIDVLLRKNVRPDLAQMFLLSIPPEGGKQ